MRKCQAKRATRPTLHRVSHSFTSAQALSNASARTNDAAPLTAIGAVSPPGGDISEPVSQATMRIVKVFWALDSSLAYARHFPAINWLTSYSLYVDTLAKWYNEQFGPSICINRDKAMHILQEESELQEIVQPRRSGCAQPCRQTHDGNGKDAARGLPAAERFRR